MAPVPARHGKHGRRARRRVAGALPAGRWIVQARARGRRRAALDHAHAGGWAGRDRRDAAGSRYDVFVPSCGPQRHWMVQVERLRCPVYRAAAHGPAGAEGGAGDGGGRAATQCPTKAGNRAAADRRKYTGWARPTGRAGPGSGGGGRGAGGDHAGAANGRARGRVVSLRRRAAAAHRLRGERDGPLPRPVWPADGSDDGGSLVRRRAGGWLPDRADAHRTVGEWLDRVLGPNVPARLLCRAKKWAHSMGAPARPAHSRTRGRARRRRGQRRGHRPARAAAGPSRFCRTLFQVERAALPKLRAR